MVVILESSTLWKTSTPTLDLKVGRLIRFERQYVFYVLYHDLKILSTCYLNTIWRQLNFKLSASSVAVKTRAVATDEQR